MSDPLEDPCFDTDRCVRRLLTQYRKHPRLIIAVDYDDTLYDFGGYGHTFPQIVQLLKDCNALDFRIVIFTSSPDSRHPEIYAECERLGVKVEAINKDLIDFHGGQGKIYYNHFLDDKCGLRQAYEILSKAVEAIKRWKAIKLDEVAIEVVKERFCGHIVSSELHDATQEHIDIAIAGYLRGECPCNVIKDKPGWMYDFRSCVICGCGLGAI